LSQFLRNKHLHLIRKSKAKAWKSFSKSINEDTWGRVYKWCKTGTKRNTVTCAVRDKEGKITTTALETTQCLLDTLIPNDVNDSSTKQEQVILKEFKLKSNEVKDSICRMSPNKAPGIDGITANVLRKSWNIISEVFTKILEECIRRSYFPELWKTANVITILKDINKDPTTAKNNNDWPCDTIVLLSSVKIYNTLANFARRVLRAKKGLS